MIDTIKRYGLNDPVLFKAMRKIDRKYFIPRNYHSEAYEDYPLPIGLGQTISQPYTTAFMIHELELKKGDTVLEVGAGSGWCAALMAEIVKPGKVISTDILYDLVQQAKKNVKRFNLKNLEIIALDGSEGYIKEAPYDKIMVTAACPKIPEPLIIQLKENGIIIAPVGAPGSQSMVKGVKRKGELETINLGYFNFVPLTGKRGFKESF